MVKIAEEKSTKTEIFQVFLAPLVFCSTCFGAAAGLFVHGYGAIPGGISGFFVGFFWFSLVCRHAETESNPRFVSVGTSLGVVMGLISTLFLHISVYLFQMVAGIRVGGHCISGNALFVIGLIVGIPVGLISGGILGAIFGNCFHSKYRKNRRRIMQGQTNEVNES